MQRMQKHMRWLKVARDLQFLKENGTYIICKTESWLIKYSIKNKKDKWKLDIYLYVSITTVLELFHAASNYTRFVELCLLAMDR